MPAKVNAVAFSSFENLTGGAQADAFVFAKGIGVSGHIDGGSGRNRLDYSAYLATTPVLVDLSAGTATNTAGIANIQDVTGRRGRRYPHRKQPGQRFDRRRRATTR